jgi:hypothetical protein
MNVAARISFTSLPDTWSILEAVGTHEISSSCSLEVPHSLILLIMLAFGPSSSFLLGRNLVLLLLPSPFSSGVLVARGNFHDMNSLSKVSSSV